MSKPPTHIWRFYFSCGRIQWRERPHGSSRLRTIFRWRPFTKAEKARHADQLRRLDPANHRWLHDKRPRRGAAVGKALGRQQL